MEKEDNKYKKDYADPDPNPSALNEAFNITLEDDHVIDMDTGEIIEEINYMRKELVDIKESLPDIDQIIIDNINRANRILDKVETSIDTGTFSASLIESAGKLIDSVTSAANSITGISYNNKVLDQKQQDLDRKERELELKNILGKNNGVTINNNTLVLNREELLKEIANSRNSK